MVNQHFIDGTLFDLAQKGLRTLYVSGEESARQIRLRAERLQVNTTDLHLLPETNGCLFVRCRST